MNKVFATIFLSLFATLLPAAFAQNDGNVVRVCNKGNVEIKYTRFLTKSGFFSGDVARVSGWYPIKAGRCHDINPNGYQTVAVGFLQTNDKGITGNPVYTVSGASRMGRSDWAPDVICVPIEKAVVYEGGLGIVREKFLPPCRAGQAALKMSFAVMPNDVFPEIKLKPQRNDDLIPWTSDAPDCGGTIRADRCPGSIHGLGNCGKDHSRRSARTRRWKGPEGISGLPEGSGIPVCIFFTEPQTGLRLYWARNRAIGNGGAHVPRFVCVGGGRRYGRHCGHHFRAPSGTPYGNVH